MVDPGLPRAGMVLSVEAFAQASPYELVPCRPDRRPPNDIDAFILHGDLFDRRWIEVLADKPLMAHRHGGWYTGDPIMRRWVLDNADLVTFNSPKQRELFRFDVNIREDFVPLPIDVDRFMLRSNDRKGTIYLGLIWPAKGIAYTVDWAIRNSHPVDFYGVAMAKSLLRDIVEPCRYCGPVDYGDVPATLAKYKRFVFFPHEPDLYARTVVEAWAAGCELILQGDEKAFWDWFDPEACKLAPMIFWQKFDSIL